jgi:hypothetical protein
MSFLPDPIVFMMMGGIPGIVTCLPGGTCGRVDFHVCKRGKGNIILLHVFVIPFVSVLANVYHLFFLILQFRRYVIPLHVSFTAPAHVSL